jgi:hypothetical protein
LATTPPSIDLRDGSPGAPRFVTRVVAARDQEV